MSSAGNGHPRELLSEYLDDELGLEERAAIDRHLAACEDCRVQLEALRRLARAIADESVPPVPLDLAPRIGRRLDAATLARPRRSRFVVPATIAATLGAIGILVALQWRDGHLGTREFDELKPSYAPSTPLPSEGALPARPARAPEKKSAAPDALDKDVKRSHEPAVDDTFKQKKDEGARFGVVSGVSGGATRQSAADDERRDQGSSKFMNEAVGVAPRELAPSAAGAPVATAKADAESSCTDHWSDSGVRGSWEVPDVDAAERELGRVAHAVSGIGLWRGVADGRPYVVVVPRERFEEVFYALRARGVTGFPEMPPLAERTDCAGIAITLVTAGTQPPTH